MKETFHIDFFTILWTPWSRKVNFHNLKCPEVWRISVLHVWKFHDHLKVCCEVIWLPSWLKNMKVSVKMVFFFLVFDPRKSPFLNEWQIWNLVFLKVDLEVLTFSKNQYFYLGFHSFKGTLKMLQVTFCPQIHQGKSLKW